MAPLFLRRLICDTLTAMTLDEARLCSHTGEAVLYLPGDLVEPSAFFADGDLYMIAPYRQYGIRPLVLITDKGLRAQSFAAKDWRPFGVMVEDRK